MLSLFAAIFEVILIIVGSVVSVWAIHWIITSTIEFPWREWVSKLIRKNNA